MSEKQFEVINARWQGKGEAVAFEDTQTYQVYFAENQEECERIVELLNEQQATINKVYELLEEADIFSDEATEHDIKAYIELQEFDNKDAYYLACGIKKAIKLLKGD